jgi:hypothetical protein
MKINNLQKNFYIFFTIVVSIFIGTVFWDKIVLPFNNTNEITGLLATQLYNPTNDLIRYVFFISLPLLIFILLKLFLKKKTINIKSLIFETERNITNNHIILGILSLIFLILVLLEFFSLSFPIKELDTVHDGDYLTSAQNYLSSKKFWLSSWVMHGGSDFFYPIITWEIFNAKTIGAARISFIFLTLFLKCFSILLAYQFTKILNLNKETKIIFFTIFTSILLSMSQYSTSSGAGYYLPNRYIFIILFLILFIELFINSKFRFLSTILIVLVATVSVLFHIDMGFYINFILVFYCLYLFIIKKFKDIILIFLSLIICWTVTINLIGFDEFKAFLYNSVTIATSADLIHGLKYPEPFFSIGNNQDGARATRGLLMQLVAGLFVLDYLISNKNKIFSSKKILFVFLLLLSFIAYRNALGRSDGGHIRISSGLPTLINSFFILNYFLAYFEKTKFLIKNNSIKKSITVSVIFILLFYTINHNHYKFKNIKKFNKNFVNYISYEDKNFLSKKKSNLVDYFKLITQNDACVQNFTFATSFPFLLKKPSCTKYFSSWLASSKLNQKDYIEKIKESAPKYILYESSKAQFDKYHKLDGLAVYDRLKLVNSYILLNYSKHKEIDAYIILKRNN